MDKPIILIYGGTGVGTTTYSFELAKSLDINKIISTDDVREVIRSILVKNVNPALDKSTYNAGQTKNYHEKSDKVKKVEIIRGYKTQCESVNIGIEGVVRRATNENLPLIIEGIHLIPGKIKEWNIYEQCKNRLVEYFVYIGDKETHRERFKRRQIESPERNMDKYLKNFQEIRWIQDYLLEKASDDHGIKLVNNIKDIINIRKEMLKHFHQKNI